MKNLAPASDGMHPGLKTFCDALLAIAAAIATAALCLQFGFYDLPVGEKILHGLEWGVLGIFLANRLLGLIGSSRRGAYLNENWFDMVVALAGAGVAVAFWDRPMRTQAIAVVSIYVIITQLYMLGLSGWQLLTRGAQPAKTFRILAVSLVVLILLGTGLLLLPKACPASSPMSRPSALFTATAAACTTGLTVRDLGTEMTLFGQLVVLVLVQLGGLVILLGGALLFFQVGRRMRQAESPLLEILGDQDAGRIARFGLILTFVLEAIGAAATVPMWARFDEGAPLSMTIFRSLFHSVSAFCNAGFSLQPDSLQALRHHWQVIGVIAPLVFLGALGLPVLYELFGKISKRAKGPLSLHSKLVLTVAGMAIVLGAALLIWNEFYSFPGYTFGAAIGETDNPYRAQTGRPLVSLPMDEQAREALFLSTARTTGFSTVPIDQLSDGGKMWMCLLMFVGGAPGSMAGGIKLVALAILVLSIYASLRRKAGMRAYGRTLPSDLARGALAVAGTQLLVVLTTALLLCMMMTGHRLISTGQPPTFMQLFFEATSACSNAGLSCGVTSSLTVHGQYVVLAGILAGRLVPLGCLVLLARPAQADADARSEDVIL